MTDDPVLHALVDLAEQAEAVTGRSPNRYVNLEDALANAMKVIRERTGLSVRPEGTSSDSEQASLWRDLVLLHPMDLMTIFSGAGRDKVLLAKLQFWIESKRGEQSKPQPSDERRVAHSKSEYKRVKAQGGDIDPPNAAPSEQLKEKT